jgi:hypothetical protein
LSLEHADIKRKGHPKAIGKDDDRFLIRVILNISPNHKWQQFFRSINTVQDNVSYLGNCVIIEDNLTFFCSEKKLEENIKLLDYYISQANKLYRKSIADSDDSIKKQHKGQDIDKQELERISKELEGL